MAFDFNRNNGSKKSSNPFDGLLDNEESFESGFSNLPEKTDFEQDLSDYRNDYSRRNRGQRHRGTRFRHEPVYIPWNLILPVLFIGVIVALLVIFRREITNFLSMVLSWVIVIVIIFLLLRWVLFGGRRR